MTAATHHQPYPCAVCRRASRGVTVSVPGAPLKNFCSEHCARLDMALGPLNLSEADAAEKGGEAAGAYLDEIGKTDLASLTLDEWREFCGRLFKGACDALTEAADAEVPF